MNNRVGTLAVVSILGLVGLLVYATSAPEPTSPGVGPRVWNKPLSEPFATRTATYMALPLPARKALANDRVLQVALVHFAMTEGRLPQTPGEVLESVYMPVEQKDFINPYTGKPVELVERPSLGNYQWYHRTIMGRNQPLEQVGFNGFVDPGDGKPTKNLGGAGINSANEVFQGSVAGQRVELYKKETASLDETDKRLFWRCKALTYIMMSVEGTDLGYVPQTYEELKQVDWWINPEEFKNPYTGALMRDVSITSPSPGDFTYGFAWNENHTGPSRPLIFCYNREGKPIFPESGVRENYDRAPGTTEADRYNVH